MIKLKVIELFGGIGAPHKALTNLGINFEVVDMVENDPKAVKSYNAVHGTNFEAQDILTWDKNIKCDYLHASTPCQAFSTAGKGVGAKDVRGAILWEATINIIKKTKPRVITMENVKGLLSTKHKELLDWYINELTILGYQSDYQVLNAKYFDIPQNRERVFIVSRNDGRPINFPEQKSVTKCLKDILVENAVWETLKIDQVKWECLNEEGEFVLSDGSTQKFIYIKNKLSQYNGKTIEVDFSKLLNQKSGEINRVAKLKKIPFDELVEENSKNMVDVYSNNVSSFYGVNGVNGVNGCVSVLDGSIQKVIKLDNIPFDSDVTFQGTKGISGTLIAGTPEFKNKIIELEDLDFNQAKSYSGTSGTSGTLRASADTIHEQKILTIDNNCVIRYRKLLPVETWLLMGFSKEDYDKARKVNSNSQLTKQAGNSIVVNVMEALLLANDLKGGE